MTLTIPGQLPSPAARLAAVLAPVAEREAAMQDALDCVAVAAALKPLAVVGLGYDAPRRVLDAVAAAAGDHGLVVQLAGRWISDREPDLPWYAEARLTADPPTPVLYVARPQTRGMISVLAARRVSAEDVAAALGYPLCCAREFHRQHRMLHLISLRMIARLADHDETRMRRLVETGIMPTPRTPAEARWLARATRVEFAPFTSIAMCRTCSAGPASPARAISAQMRALAAQSGFAHLAA